MAKRFEGKSVFITGASAGIGAAVAVGLAREGARIALAARRKDRLEEVKAKVEAAGGQAMTVACDVCDRASVDAAVAEVAGTFGGIDVALANAGMGIAGLFENLDVEAFRRQFETNFFGVLNTVYAVLPHLVASKGTLGLVSSVAGRVGTPTTTAYCASKFAVYGLAEALYYELAERGVAVTCIQPGFVQSEIRHIDNQGAYHPDRKDPIPSFLVVPTERAAQEIIGYLHRRKFNAIITGHGKAIVFLNRLFPGTVRLAQRLATKGKLNPRANAGKGFQEL